MSIPSDSGYKLTLYYRDLNVPYCKDEHKATTPDAKDGVQAVHDFVINHFQLTDPTDRELFSSIISLYPSSEHIAFYRKDKPKVMHGIKPEGNATLLKDSTMQTPEATLKKGRIVEVTCCTFGAKVEKEFNFQTLKGPRADGDCIFKKPAVALYNSNSFNKVVEQGQTTILALEAKDYGPQTDPQTS